MSQEIGGAWLVETLPAGWEVVISELSEFPSRLGRACRDPNGLFHVGRLRSVMGPPLVPGPGRIWVEELPAVTVETLAEASALITAFVAGR